MKAPQRLSSFLALAGMRSRHSWTSWRLTVRQRRLRLKVAKAEQHLLLLQRLQAEQRFRLNQLQEQQFLAEERQYPLLGMTQPSEPEERPSLMLLQPERQPMLSPQPEMPPAEDQIARLLGPLPPRPTPPSSES